MYWEEDKPQEQFVVPDHVVDVVYDIDCRSLPVDHAYALFTALRSVLPWLVNEPAAGIHPIHVADSGNGWMRPENPTDLLHLSRRTKLMLRLPKARIADARALIGTTLDIADNALKIVGAATRPLTAINTIFSRYVAFEGFDSDDEMEFLNHTAQRLRELGVTPQKMLCGRLARIATPGGVVRARSLMLANLTLAESMQLQLHGLGSGRQLGCGLFIGHKDINEIKQKSG